MRKAVNEAPEPVRDKLKAAIVAGEITTPAEAEVKGRRMAAERTKRTKPLPPDLETAMVGWNASQFKDYVDRAAQERIDP